eukprot:g626.t1
MPAKLTTAVSSIIMSDWARWKDYQPSDTPGKSIGVVFSSKANAKSKWQYYWDFYSAIRRQPAIVHCGFIQPYNIEWSRCKNLPIVLMVLPQDGWWIFQMKKLMRSARHFGFPVVLMANRVYWTQVLRKKLAVVRAHRSRFVTAFTWSPHTAGLSRAAGLRFNWLPFAVNFPKFDLSHVLSADHHQSVAYKYDLGFTGTCQRFGYRTRWEACSRFNDLSAHGVTLTPNLVDWPKRAKTWYNYHQYRVLMASTRMWLATVGWHDSAQTCGAHEADCKHISVTPSETVHFFPHGVDLVGTRYFEVMASNTTMVLCDRCTVCASLFTDGHDVVMFDGFKDLLAKVRHYSNPKHEGERLRIVRNAAAKAKRYHTYKHRANFLAHEVWHALRRKCKEGGDGWGATVSRGVNSRWRPGAWNVCALLRAEQASRREEKEAAKQKRKRGVELPQVRLPGAGP